MYIFQLTLNKSANNATYRSLTMLVIDYTIVGSGHVLSHSYDGCPAQRGSGWNRLRDVVDKTQMNPIQISNSKWMDTWTFGFNWYTSHIYQAEKASHPVQKSSYMGGHFKLNSIIAIECLFEYITVDMSERKKIRQTSVHDQTSDSHSAKRCDSRDYLYAIAEAEVSSNGNSRYRYQWGTHFCSTKLSLSWCFSHLFNNIEFWEGEWIKLISIFILSLFIRGENEIKFIRVKFKNNIIFYFFKKEFLIPD